MEQEKKLYPKEIVAVKDNKSTFCITAEFVRSKKEDGESLTIFAPFSRYVMTLQKLHLIKKLLIISMELAITLFFVIILFYFGMVSTKDGYIYMDTCIIRMKNYCIKNA